MKELIKIKEMTGKYGISARTLRYYEDMGLIASTRSDDYAYRLYDDAAVKKLEQILILRRLNVSIKDIRRVFDAPGSEAVLEVLDNKISDIDDEVALLYELKEVILEFIRQIRDADFANDGDVKLLYEKARDIETQLANVDYNGNPSAVNRLLEVTEKLERKPEIVKRKPHFYLHLHVRDPIGACKLYRQAFDAVMTSEEYLPNGDPYITIIIDQFPVLLRPCTEVFTNYNKAIAVHFNESSNFHDNYLTMGVNGHEFTMRQGEVPLQGCSVSFASELELRHAFDILTRDGQGWTDKTAHWTPLCAWVRDMYDVGWFFCVDA